MKKIGLGIVLGAFGLSNSLNTPQDDGASILINWSNNKGEKKVFKIDDMEQDNGNEKIHSKTLLQKYVRTIDPCNKGCSVSRSCSRGYDDGACDCDRSCSKDYSKGKYSCRRVKKYKKPFIIEHRPQYKKYITYKPRNRSNRLHKKNNFNRNIKRNNSADYCYDKNYDTKINKASADDLAKLLKLNKQNNDNLNIKKNSANKYRKNQDISKYLKDDAKKYIKKNNERSCSNENYNKLNNARKYCNTHQKDKDAEKNHEKEYKDSHNIVNLNHKANEALLMKEQDKDNLHSNDKVIEEFDKLEHFKKVEERCRNASKARHAHVNKNECLDKNQKQKKADSNHEVRFNKRLRANKNQANDDFCNLDKCNANRNSRYLKDENCFDANKANEKEFNYNDKKEKEDADSLDLTDNKNSCLDFADTKNKCSKDKKKIFINDDENSTQKRNNNYHDNICKENNQDATFFDNCNDINGDYDSNDFNDFDDGNYKGNCYNDYDSGKFGGACYNDYDYDGGKCYDGLDGGYADSSYDGFKGGKTGGSCDTC